MSANTIESESKLGCKRRSRRASASHQEGQARKESRPSKKAASKPKAERANKKAEVIAMMKRAKGATLAEIMTATGWQPHTVRGFVSILGSKGGEKIESSKSAPGSARTTSQSSPQPVTKRRFRFRPGRRFLLL